MGFDVTAANIVFFIAFLAAGSVALGAYWHNASYVEDARRVESARGAEIAHTNMSVASTSYDSATDRFTVTIKNMGSSVIDITKLSYLVNGAIVAESTVESTSVAGAGTTDLWLPLETLTVQLRPIDPSPSYFQVVTENGARANWRS